MTSDIRQTDADNPREESMLSFGDLEEIASDERPTENNTAEKREPQRPTKLHLDQREAVTVISPSDLKFYNPSKDLNPYVKISLGEIITLLLTKDHVFRYCSDLFQNEKDHLDLPSFAVFRKDKDGMVRFKIGHQKLDEKTIDKSIEELSIGYSKEDFAKELYTRLDRTAFILLGPPDKRARCIGKYAVKEEQYEPTKDLTDMMNYGERMVAVELKGGRVNYQLGIKEAGQHVLLREMMEAEVQEDGNPDEKAKELHEQLIQVTDDRNCFLSNGDPEVKPYFEVHLPEDIQGDHDLATCYLRMSPGRFTLYFDGKRTERQERFLTWLTEDEVLYSEILKKCVRSAGDGVRPMIARKVLPQPEL